MNSEKESIVLGGGCFWCLEAVFDHVKGVSSIVSGYAGGAISNPTYQQVSSGKTGHAEVVKVEFDPAMISFEDILHIFFTVHDPTTLNRQGSDIGSQYRSVILFSDDRQRDIAKKVIKELKKEKVYANEIVTELKTLDKFYPAEQYHQRYFEKNPEQSYCQIVIAPKVARFRQKFNALYE